VDIHVVILAAGKGTRMRSTQPKVLHRLGGASLIEHVLRTAASLGPKSATIVVGHMAEHVRSALQTWPGLQFAIQEPQLGTAHALLQAERFLADKPGTLLLLSGDVPLLAPRTLTRLVHQHEQSHAALTVLTANVEDPHGYGRIVRLEGRIARIVEEKDASPAERRIREINSGIYAFALEGLFDTVRAIDARNAQGEHYLPDMVAVLRRRGRHVDTLVVEDPREIRGINSREELADAGRFLRQQKNDELMAAGVTIEDPASTFIDPGVIVGTDTVLHPFVMLEGRTRIGAGCEIHSGTRIVNSMIGDGVAINNHCVITDSRVGPGAVVGPFAHLRADADVREDARVGNFVELKKTSLGSGSKAMHLAYLGDATIGSHVNIGAGTITCNYDGSRKQPTMIEDGAFIGSDSQLIAPVTVGKGAYVGSGTTVRENVPPGALAVSAGKQRNIEDWVEGRKKKIP
jgi:bifunctional UDP-N-acetylglucosamine pyrophosphorylase/glucosamine-1-phosphate N-acetyltransferase